MTLHIILFKQKWRIGLFFFDAIRKVSAKTVYQLPENFSEKPELFVGRLWTENFTTHVVSSHNIKSAEEMKKSVLF